MGDFSTERLAPSPQVVEPKPEHGQRDPARPPRRKPLPKANPDQEEGEAPDASPHHLDRLA
jgi:hypothetical protein